VCARLILKPLQHPGRWYWLFLLLPILLGLSRLQFDVEVLDLLPGDAPAVRGLKLYQQHFANARELVITVRGTDADGVEATARTLAERLRLETNLVAAATWEMPWIEHPDQAAEFLAYLWFNQPPERFRELTNRLAPANLAATLTATREKLASSLSPQDMAQLSYDPYGLTRLPDTVAGAAPSFGPGQSYFASAAGTFRIIFVQAREELRTYRDCDRWLAAIKEAVAGTVPHGEPDGSGVRIRYTGRPAFVTEIARGMQRDITLSVCGTALIIAVLFWLAHRRLKPMLWLLTLLAIILAATLALGGLIFGKINVVSMGFAAILLGLAVDYAVVHYQEALAHPALSIPEIRRAIAPSIFWAAVTTISAFLVLNWGGLPGLAQLGTLVGLGVALAACIMIFEFLPPLFPDRRQPSPAPAPLESQPAKAEVNAPPSPSRRALTFAGTLSLLVIGLVILLRGLPQIDATADALRPRQSEAYAALDELKHALEQNREPLWLLLAGTDEAEIGQALDAVRPVLDRAVANGAIAGVTLPNLIWPRPAAQAANRATARALVAERDLLHAAALTNGFTREALVLTDRLLDTWARASDAPGAFWPTNRMSEWIFEKLTARTPTNLFALGLLTPMPARTARSEAALERLEHELPGRNVWLSGWELLGSAIFGIVKRNLWKVVVPMITLVLLSLLLAFRRWQEILLSLAVLLLSALCLLTVMRLAGWSWNLLNLMGLPLMLGTGVDYSIFMQLALRRYHGDWRLAHRSVGRALLLCGGTAIAGFGSLAWSSNAGMASLGQVCAVGIGGNMLISVLLLPVWWLAFGRPTGDPTPAAEDGPAPLSAPSSLYRARVWGHCMAVANRLPQGIAYWLSRRAADLYWLLAPRRRRVVIENLLPACEGNAAAARLEARKLFHQFGVKLVDLWRFEAGRSIEALLGATTGAELVAQLRAQNRGALLLTPHLGNWEFGGPSLTRQGLKLQVITLHEPGERFTEMRQRARERWNIETLVIGKDAFAFVEIIRRLEAGAVIAMLVDRPPPPTAVTVELFGRPFAASVAAAELARASGCALIPVYIPRVNGKYSAHMLPPVNYDRASLRDPRARQQLTQELMRVFEPLIRQHLDQWFHFVPVWPRSENHK
jgi:predicted RND superfamily exporter protein/lauroyl/myristoyl acyltransferase